MSYTTFAAFYDEIMDDSLYEKWLAFTHLVLKNQKGSILELACGTGKLAVELSREGYEVTGLDLSDDMLSLAYNTALEQGQDIQLIQGDMRELSGIGRFDAVTCFSDSLCYMADEKEMEEVFKSVHSVLNERGTFLFDVHSLHQVNEVFPGYQYHYLSEDAAFLWSSFSGETENSVEHELTFFINENKNGMYTRYEEQHKERTYSIENYKRMLDEAGFVHIDVSAEFGEEEVSKSTKRWFFSCRKQGE